MVLFCNLQWTDTSHEQSNVPNKKSGPLRHLPQFWLMPCLISYIGMLVKSQNVGVWVNALNILAQLKIQTNFDAIRRKWRKVKKKGGSHQELNPRLLVWVACVYHWATTMANHDPSQSSKWVNVFYCTHITKLVLALSCFFSSSILSSCSSITDSHSVRQLVREVSSLCSPSSWDLGRKRGKEGGGGGIRREKRRGEEREEREGRKEGAFFISVKLSQQHTPGIFGVTRQV